MIRWLFAIVGGILLGGVVHLVSVLALPRIASQDAYARLDPVLKVNTVMALPDAAPDTAPMPFMDPAFAAAACKYDLTGGSIKLKVPVSQAYTSVSFYTNRGLAYYAINDRAAGRRTIELDLMTTQQRGQILERRKAMRVDAVFPQEPRGKRTVGRIGRDDGDVHGMPDSSFGCM